MVDVYGLTNPYAELESTGKLVCAEEVTKDDGPFSCRECGRELFHRKRASNGRRTHFAHGPESTCTGGSPESWEHKNAKGLVVDYLDKWTFVVYCAECANVVRTCSFHNGEVGLLERNFAVGDKYRRPDVTVVLNGTAVAAIEVEHTHAVSDDKRADLQACKLVLLEVDATQIILAHRSKNYTAEVIRSTSTLCQSCKTYDEMKRLKKMERDLRMAELKEIKRHCPYDRYCCMCDHVYYDNIGGYRNSDTYALFGMHDIDWKLRNKLCRPCAGCGKWYRKDALCLTYISNDPLRANALVCDKCCAPCSRCGRKTPACLSRALKYCLTCNAALLETKEKAEAEERRIKEDEMRRLQEEKKELERERALVAARKLEQERKEAAEKARVEAELREKMEREKDEKERMASKRKAEETLKAMERARKKVKILEALERKKKREDAKIQKYRQHHKSIDVYFFSPK